ncbi:MULTISPECIES: hypothetical protein [unclassified Shinella]|jgi:5-methylcytosine-specific restriction protein A|uniref:hypothetical protein n=1 Tax=unclassified Shinella TaxID=2643062 RepID=UPI00102D3A39|nr:hypothetical protein [Shinella sp. JR1-6]TAA60890.1 hypothetical protein EXZ48_14020 [Shinella sp. JR1-6]
MRGPRSAEPGAEGRFHKEMMALYDRFATLGFRPVLLRRFVLLNGGVGAAKELVFKPGTTGLERLLDAGKPELSMEAMMLRPEYRDLFSELELKEATQRLASASRSRSRGRLQAQPTERK